MLKGRFQAVEYLGEGSEGVVMLVKHNQTGELVALKRFFMRPGLNEHLLLEVEILNICQHKNVVELKQACLETSGESFMIFEYMQYDLATLKQRLSLSPLQIKIVMKQVLQGLAHCHANNVLHLDIKPANVLVNDDGAVKVADFRLSCKLSANCPLPHPHYVGTPQYKAPELLLGSTSYGSGVDIWSVGCLFAEMLEGYPLFLGCDCTTSQCTCNVEERVFQQILELCGTPDESNWPGVTKFKDFDCMMQAVAPAKRTLTERFEHLEEQAAVELLERMLSLNPDERISAEEALEAEYFTGPRQSGMQLPAEMVASNPQAIKCC